ncbi:DUF2057 domain-containing protein [Grimontia kaedaensis]|uniref:UPF0319 protein K6Q96_04795 n=1 Tax=Grimontia kaedaensis TaxID=2872157 RepID=A0ABY4WVJ6_9GAMM|nr:DUF2057 domain-containing protein [Grimontia kaedaensis]USH03335.1 DUF2057 domain-containing protein [Grimontia kaedaensis]
MRLLAVYSALLVFTSVVAATEIEIGTDLQAYVLNGKEVDASSGDRLNLVDGSNQLVVRYKSILNDGSNTKFFESKPYVFQFTNMGQDLSISIERFRKHIQAEKAFKKGTAEWFIKDSTDKKVAFQFDELPGNSGFLPYGDLPKALATYNKKNGIYFEGQEIKDLNEEVVVAVSETGKVELTGDALAQLKLWYTKASKEERKAFRIWVIDQE